MCVSLTPPSLPLLLNPPPLSPPLLLSSLALFPFIQFVFLCTIKVFLLCVPYQFYLSLSPPLSLSVSLKYLNQTNFTEEI